MMVIEGNILTGQQLITSRLKDNNSRDLPLIGQKDFQPTKSWLEEKQIQSALNERKALIEEERIEKWSSLSVADWVPGVKKAKVIRKVGKTWDSFGHHSEDSDWLFPEEALLLLETNALELLYNEVPLSIERAYVLLIRKETDCSLNEYRTFSHLVRLGYKVFRHSSKVSVTGYEKEIRLDQHVLHKKRVYSTGNTDVVATNSGSSSSTVQNIVNEESDLITIDDNRVFNHSVVANFHKRLMPSLEKGHSSVIQVDADESINSCDISVAGKCIPNRSNRPVEICIDDDDDDVIEIPLNKEIFVVNDVTSSSDSEDLSVIEDEVMGSAEESNDNDSSKSTCSRRSNSNWKRSSSSVNRRVPPKTPPLPRYAIRTNYVTVNEFLFDPKEDNRDKANDDEVIVLSDDDTCIPGGKSNGRSSMGDELQRFYKEIEIIDVESDTDDANRNGIRNLSRCDILNSFPMYKNGEMWIKIPPLFLLPPNVKPFRTEYRMKFVPSDMIHSGYNDWGHHKLMQSNINSNVSSSSNCSTRAPSHQPSRSYNRPYHQSRNRSVMPYYKQQQWNMYSNNMIQNQIRAMATGVMQVASTLLSSLPFVSQSFSGLQSYNNNPQFYQQQFNNAYQQPAGYVGNNYFNNHNNSNLQSFTNPYPAVQPSSNAHYNYNLNPQNYGCHTENSGVRNETTGNRNENFRNRSENCSGSLFRCAGSQFADRNRHEPCSFVPSSSHTSFNRGNIMPQINDRMYQNQQQSVGVIPPLLSGNIALNTRHQLPQPATDRLPETSKSQMNCCINNDSRLLEENRQQNDNVTLQNADKFSNMRSDITNNISNNNNNNNNNNRNRNRPQNNKMPTHGGYRHRPPVKRYYRPRQTRRPMPEPNEEQPIIIDTEGDPSVFVDDIPLGNASGTTESGDFIPFSCGNNNSNNNNNNKDANVNTPVSFVNSTVAIGGTEFIVMDDLDNYNNGREYRNRMSARNERPRNLRRGGRFYGPNRNRDSVVPWHKKRNNRSNFNEDPSPNKRQRPDNFNARPNVNNAQESNFNKNHTNKNFSNWMMDVAQAPDSDDITSQFMRQNVRSEMVTEKRGNHRRNKRNRNRFFNMNDLLDIGNIEVIDIEGPEESHDGVSVNNVKQERCDANVEKQNVCVKVETANGNQINNHRVQQLRISDKDDESSRNSLLSGYSISTISSSIIKSETSVFNVNNVKVETSTVKTENVSTSTSVRNTFATAAVSVTLENVKTENAVNNVSELPASETVNTSIKIENDAELVVKQEKTVGQTDTTLMDSIKTENHVNVVNDMDASGSNKENEMEIGTEVQRSDNVGRENLTWADLKRKTASATNVNERIEIRDVDEDENLEDDEEEMEDEDTSTDPLITAEDCKSLGSVLSALQIIGRAKSSDLPREGVRKLKISYDVYIPKSVPLKKSSRGLPDYRLVVVDFRDALPTPSEMADLHYRFEDGIPILIATVLPDSISFMMAANVCLPVHD